MRAGVLVILFACALASGCTDAGGDGCAEWHCYEGYRDDDAWRSATIEPGYALEMDFSLRPDQELAWDWFVTDRSVIAFQLHYHRPDGMEEKVFEKRLRQSSDTYTAPEANTYSLLWLNDTEAAREVWLRVEGEICYPHGCGTLIEL